MRSKKTKRHKNYFFALLFLDLDYFKLINDSFGHPVGDRMLIKVGKKLEVCLRPGDTVARVGGDEFIILLEDVKDADEAARIAERIQEELSSPFDLEGQEVFTTASIGIALSTTSYDQPEDLLRYGDTAMYCAKALGRARYKVFDMGMHAHVVKRLQLEADLSHALERQEFLIHYQPIVSLTSGKITGVEALVRWHHPQRGLLSAMEFIPMAEETGLIVPIGEWVLNTACAQNKAWQEAGLPPLCLKVNVSTRQLKEKSFSETVIQALNKTGLAPHYVGLEVTESAVIENIEETTVALQKLKEIGVELSVDDFGTGFPSLQYLKGYLFDVLKIDQSFVQNIAINAEDEEIVKVLITLGHSLKLKVIAEGVETEEQLAFLRSHKCDEAQGFLFNQPVQAEELMKLLQEGRCLPYEPQKNKAT